MSSRIYSPKRKFKLRRSSTIDLDTYINYDYSPSRSTISNRVYSPYQSLSQTFSPSNTLISSNDYSPVNSQSLRFSPANIRVSDVKQAPSLITYYDPLTYYFYSYFFNPQQYSSEELDYSPTYEHAFRYHPRVFINNVDRNIDLVVAQTPIIYKLIKELLR